MPFLTYSLEVQRQVTKEEPEGKPLEKDRPQNMEETKEEPKSLEMCVSTLHHSVIMM